MPQPLWLVFRRRNTGIAQRGGSRDRNDGVVNRGSSAEGHDRYPRPGGYGHRDGSSDRSDQQDRFAPRHYNRDLDRHRDMGRGRRMDRSHLGKEQPRAVPGTRQLTANSTISASRGADGRIEIAADPTSAPSVTSTTPSVTSEAAAAGAAVQPRVAASKPMPLPAQSSPTSPLPLAVDPKILASMSSADSQKAAQVSPISSHREPPLLPSSAASAPTDVVKHSPAEHSNGLPMSNAGPSACSAAPSSAAAGAVHLTLPPATAEASHANGPVTPQSAPHSPLAIPSLLQPAQHAAQVTRQPTVLQSASVHSMASANGPVPEAGALPSQAVPLQASAPLHQILPFKPKVAPGVFPGNAQMPNGHAGPQQHQHSSGPQANLPGGRTRSFPPQQQQQLLQQLQQQQQQLPRRQPEKSQMFSPGQGHQPLPGSALPPHMQVHAGQQGPIEQGHAQISPQGRTLHQPQQPGPTRSSSIGQKRPMPIQEPQHVPPNQPNPPQQQRGQATPSGPPTMGNLPFNGQMHPNSIPHYISSPNGMPPNVSMPGPRAPNGIPFSIMQHSQRPSMIHHIPMMTPANIAMGKSAPLQHPGSLPYNPYMTGMGQMPAPINSSSPHLQNPSGPHPAQNGPQYQPQAQMQSAGLPFTPPQRMASLPSGLPNGHIRATPAPGMSPAASLGNAASKGSSVLRATALPFVPGGVAQPASPITAQLPPVAAQHAHILLQTESQQQQPGLVVASAAPFLPGSDVAGQLDSPLHRPTDCLYTMMHSFFHVHHCRQLVYFMHVYILP